MSPKTADAIRPSKLRRRLPAALLLAVLVPAAYAFVSWTGGARRVPAPPRPGAYPPAAVPVSDWDGMTREVEEAARKHPSRVAVYLKDLRGGREWSHHADDLFPSASLIKVPIMAAVFAKVAEGEISLDTKLSLKRRMRMGGSGTIKWKRDGTRFTVRQLLEKLIIESDNTAMRILIEEVGMAFLQKQFPRMGLLYTEIYPEGLSLKDGRVKFENYTTAREMGVLLEKIYRGEMVNTLSSEIMLDIMKRRRVRSRLAKGLPVGWEIAHKTGLLRGACHDAAILFSPEGEYVLVVLTGQNSSYPAAKNFISKVGKITYKHYNRESGLYAKATASRSRVQ